MGWLENRANAARGISPNGSVENTNNVPNITNSPNWLSSRAQAARDIQVNTAPIAQPVPIQEPVKKPSNPLQAVQSFISNLLGKKTEDKPLEQPTPETKKGNLITQVIDSYKNFTNNQLKKTLADRAVKLTEEVKGKKDPKKIENLKSDIEEINVALNQPSLGKKYLVSSKQKFMRDLGSVGAGASTLVSSLADFYNRVYEQDAETMSKMATVNKDSKVLNWLFKQESQKSAAKTEVSQDISKSVRTWAEEVSPANPDFMDGLKNGIGSMGAFLVASVASGGGATEMAVLEAMSESGTVYRENRETGKDVATSSEVADKDFLANLVINYYTNKFGIFTDKQAGIRKTIMSASAEGTQEALQQVASNLSTGKDMMEGVPESLGIGAILGGAVSPLNLGGTTENTPQLEPSEGASKPTEEAPKEPEKQPYSKPELPLFRGTDTSTSESIAEKGFNLSKHATLGDVIYMTDSKDSAKQFGDNIIEGLTVGDFKWKVFDSLNERNAFVEEMAAKTVSEAINKEGIYDGFYEKDFGEGGNNFVLTNKKKADAIMKERFGKKVEEVKPTLAPAEAVQEQETQMRDSYKGNIEKVDQALVEVFTEMEVAEAGKRFFYEQPDTMDLGVIGQKSSFPSWVPEDLRSRELFDIVLRDIRDIETLKYPGGNRSRQRALYDAILDEIDKRSGVNTSKQRSAIIKQYDLLNKKQKDDRQDGEGKKAVRRSIKRSETTSEEINAAPIKDKESVERDTKTVAKTPEQLKEIIDNLNRYGQSHAILRRTGGLSGARIKGFSVAGLFVPPGTSKKATGVAKEGEVRLKGTHIADDTNYISTLAHELGHATEFHLTGATNKKTMQVFGEKLSPEQRSKVLEELKAVTEQLEGKANIAKNPEYYNKPTEQLARFFEMYIINPELLQETAPTALELIETQSIKHPMLREFLEIVDENMMKKDKAGKTFLPDLRETYQKALGSKRVGNIAYYAEITHRAMVERAKRVLPDFINSKFKGVKDDSELLFRVAESIKVTKDGVPEFGTRDFTYLETEFYNTDKSDALRATGYEYVSTEIKDGVSMDTYAKSRYTPAEAESLYEQLSDKGKLLIKDFTAQRSEAKDYFNREVIKEINGITSNLEGWVHHYFEEGKGTTVGKSLRFRKKKAGATMHRTGNEGYVMDLKKAVTKAIVELETAKSFNNFVDKQFARVSKPIPEGQNPDAGWVEVMGNLRKGVGLEGDSRTTIITPEGKAVKAKQTRYQIPQAVYERYKLYRGLVEEASATTKFFHRLNSYWAINILTDVGSAGTNFIGGGIQYSAKVLKDFYTETLTGDVSYKQTRRDVTAMLKVLLPKGWHSAPDWVYGADLSNWYGQFSQKQISKSDKALDALADKNLKLFGSIERYWKKVIMVSENVKDVASLNEVGIEGLRLPTKEEENMIAKINAEVDLFAFDYDNIPLWLTNMKKNPVGTGIKPFATYPYKYAKNITNMVGSAFDQSLPWQDRAAKLLALSTLMAIYAAFSYNRKKKQQTPEATSPEIEIRAKAAGNLFTGVTDEEGNELFVRVSKYPYFGLTEAAIQTMKGNTDSASNIFKEMLGSIGFLGKTGLNVLGYRDQYEKFDPTEVVLGNNLSSLVPYTRILDEISRGLDPYKRKQTTFGQTFTRLIPTTDADLQEKLHGEARTVTIPIEGEVKRTPGTAYTRTTVDRTLKNYWKDILLSSLTGIYLKRVNPKDVEAQLIRDEENRKKKEKEEKKKSLKGSK